ncbi:DUF3576 domain-containing protein [Litoreibacter roseus]|uniref:DUF3576 domain-containing protein n=1 Tax=Litoreibacter roseus TaxID=2601869 RepID=UPI001FAB0388|nr:DUF3576 domain-containing protein [Litoreibacter roseus]
MRLALNAVLALALAGGVAACGGQNDTGFERDFDSAARTDAAQRRDSLFDLFDARDDPNTTLEVNKYLWNASLDVLNFMPLQAADPFTGTIVLGYGSPQGSSRAYRATVYISDPALDARSLRVALQGRNGAAVDRETSRAVEDAILNRARQLRIRDTNL